MKKIKTRDIKFRAKRADNGEWVEGFYFLTGFAQEGKPLLEPCIQVIKGGHYHNSYKVIPETVGQFTGLTDKNGKEIFEGDIIMTKSPYRYFIAYENGAFYAYHCEIKDIEKSPYRWGLLSRSDELDMEAEVIGNIHDNPELVN